MLLQFHLLARVAEGLYNQIQIQEAAAAKVAYLAQTYTKHTDVSVPGCEEHVTIYSFAGFH